MSFKGLNTVSLLTTTGRVLVPFRIGRYQEARLDSIVEKTRQRYHALRQRLQKRGTKSAKRHLRKLSGKEARFRKNSNHVISKRIVQKASKTHQAIALEDLRHIRTRTERTLLTA